MIAIHPRRILSAATTLAACLVTICTAGPAMADKCAASKNTLAGKDALCRHKAEVKALKKGLPVDFSKCDAILAKKWPIVTEKAANKGTPCVDDALTTEIRTYVHDHAAAVSYALGGQTLAECGSSNDGDPGVGGKCRQKKNILAGKYALCRQKAVAKGLKKGLAADFTKCDDKLTTSWDKLEQTSTDKGEPCVDTVDSTAIQDFVTNHSDRVTAWLAGGAISLCPQLCELPSDCDSNNCFVINPPFGPGGVCSECDEDADCAGTTGFGCGPPSLVSGEPATCSVSGAIGEPCETVDACAEGLFCPVLVEIPGILTYSTCSECSEDSHCSPQLCVPFYDIPTWTGFHLCVDPATRANGEGCNLMGDGSDCTSGNCAPAEFAGIAVMGLCSPCNEDSDCLGGETCEFPELTISDGTAQLTPGTCSPP